MEWGRQLRPGQRRVSAVTVLVGIVMLLLPALAWMQYQWLGQLSTAERERMQRTLRTAAAQFATEFDTELSRTLISLQVDGTIVRDRNWPAYAQRYSTWVNSASEPRLVKEVLLVDTVPGTALPNPMSLETPIPIPPERLQLRKWNEQSLTFDDQAWPAGLEGLRSELATRFTGMQAQRPRPQEPGPRREPSLAINIGDDDTLVAPVTLFDAPDGGGPPKISLLGFTIVRLDPAITRDTVLASLAARHFHGNDNEADYRVAVVERENPSEVIWESEPGIAKLIIGAPDVKQPFMGPRPEQMIVFARNMRGDNVPVPPPPPGPALGAASKPGIHDDIVVQIERDERGGGGRGRVITRAGQFTTFEGRWLLIAQHRAGSL